MQKIKYRKFLLKSSLLLCLFLFPLLGKAYGMSVKTGTYIVIPKNNKGELQSLAIKRAIRLSLKKAVKKLTGKKTSLNKNDKRIFEKEIYSRGLKYIYSFKIITAKKYFNLYYVNIIVYIRRNFLASKLKKLGFKTVKRGTRTKQINYNVYYVKFIGNFSYSDSNKFQKLMIKYSRHLQNLYISSFSENFAEVKILYYGSIIRLLKKVKPIIKTYLNADVYPVRNNTIIIDVK